MPEAVSEQFKINLISPGFRGPNIDRKMIFLCYATNISVLAGAYERQEILRLHHQSIFFEHSDGGGVDKRLGIGQDTVHVKNHRTNLAPLPYKPPLSHGRELKNLSR